MKSAKSPGLPQSDAPEGLEVWLDDAFMGPLTHMGRLHRSGLQAVRFEYSPHWLAHPLAFQLDPELSLSAGDFYPRESNFGIFLDSCPDRWGQVLMRRRELVEARVQGRTRRELQPWDFFLGVQDVTRMGALRFSALQSQRQLKQASPQWQEGLGLANQALSAPALTRMGELQAVALELTRQKVDDLDLLQQWLKVLVAPGSSLGGARPKANLQDGQGRLWIAKFPSADDEHDWALREMLVHQLANEFSLQAAEARVERIGRGHHTFVTLRFDRAQGRRRFFSSAMALLGKVDSEKASYLDLAGFLSHHGSEDGIAADLQELFSRVLFNVAVANRDDHLRNHGFMRSREGWRLAPAFDMNPSTKKSEHVLAIDNSSPLPDLNTAMATAPMYRLTPSQAQATLARLRKVLGAWEVKAKLLGLSAEDRLELKDCFQV